MSTTERSTVIRCDRYDRGIRSDRTFQYSFRDQRDASGFGARASCFEVTGAWAYAIMLNRR